MDAFPRVGRALAPLALAAVGMLAMAACGGDRSGGPQGTPAGVVGRSLLRTLEAGTARVHIDGIDATATGVVDLPQGAGRYELSPGPVVLRVGASSFVMDRDGGAWHRAAADPFPPSLQAGDPFLALDLLRGVVSVDPYGGAEVRGASTLRYTVQVDLARAAAAAPQPDTAGPLPAAAAEAGTGRLRMDVFIDHLGRVRRILLPAQLRPGPPPTRVDGEVRGVTVDFDGFGLPVHLAPPPSDQLVD